MLACNSHLCCCSQLQHSLEHDAQRTALAPADIQDRRSVKQELQVQKVNSMQQAIVISCVHSLNMHGHHEHHMNPQSFCCNQQPTAVIFGKSGKMTFWRRQYLFDTQNGSQPRMLEHVHQAQHAALAARRSLALQAFSIVGKQSSVFCLSMLVHSHKAATRCF